MKKKLRNKSLGIGHWSLVGSQWLTVYYAFGIVILFIFLSNCSRENKHQHEPDVYTCPMHPTVVQNKPGTCPICGMELVLKEKPGESRIANKLNTQSPNEAVVSSIKTTTIMHKTLPVALKVQGLVTYDTRNLYTISARFSGRIEKIYARYAFQKIKKGEKVATIYSPEIATAEQELIYLHKNDKDNTALIKSTNKKLILLGLSQKQIDEVVERAEVSNTVSIFSPYSGYLIGENQKVPTTTNYKAAASTSNMGGEMSSSSSSNASNTIQSNSSQMLREGSYVSTGETLFKLINTSALRVELDLPISQAATIKTGDQIDLELNNELRKAQVDFIQPFFNDNEEFIKIRVYLKNADDLLVGQLVNATLHLKPISGDWLPKEAVVDLGLDKIVFVKHDGVFKPIKIALIYDEGNLVAVNGLTKNDTIAYHAQYLVDSESFIKTSK